LSRKKGDIAESRAVGFLSENGFTILDRNYHSRFGEIDIVALKDRVLHFVEVKSGKGEPIYRVTPQKLSKIEKTSQFYINQKRLDFDFCFDVIEIKEDEINFVENVSFY